MALKALAKGSVEYTLAYDAVYNEPGSPWFKMFEEAVYSGNVSTAIHARPDKYPDHAGQREELDRKLRAASPELITGRGRGAVAVRPGEGQRK